MISSFLIFNIIFCTVLLFFVYLAFAQWRMTKDALILWYIGYLLFSFAHYGRDFWVNGFFRFHIFNAPPDPPLQWNSPSSYAAHACYLMFIAQVLSVGVKTEQFTKVLTGVARFFALGIALHLLVQCFWGSSFADKIHQINLVLLVPILLWIMIKLFQLAQLFYEKLILLGTVALIIGFLSAVATRLLPRHDWIDGVICCFKTPWGWSFVLYHMKIGILLDVVCFSWALTLRQKELLSKKPEVIIKKEVVLPLSSHLADDPFLQAIHNYLTQNYQRETLNVAELAQTALHLSPDVVTRKLKEKTGLTTEQYILRYRLERALEFLISTDKSIGEISTDTGFKNDAHFSRAFKRHYDRTPGEMRRNLHQKGG
jgi:AraC-like DNA-binding protein